MTNWRKQKETFDLKKFSVDLNVGHWYVTTEIT